MAKINHNNSLDTISELLTNAKQHKVIHLESDITTKSNRKLPILNHDFLNFGTCGYLSLEADQRLKDGAAEYAQKYGTQYGISRGYLSSGINVLLEDFLSKMFDNRRVLTYSSTSSAHISVIPSLITPDDAIILDQQVHFSLQTAAQLARQKGSPVEMIRHSNMDMLEKQVIELRKRNKKVWYLIDGVYSMYGDVAPMDKLLYLMEKYEQLYVYVDDAHGMSWAGKNGTGYFSSKVPRHDKIMLMTTMGKGFGVTGGLAVFPNNEMYKKVRIFGGPLIYSHPLAPPIIGAAIASAKIHLSGEIYTIQKELSENIDYSSQLLSQTELPILSHTSTPIGFLAIGQPKVGYNMVKRLLNDGFFVNLALFPAVPAKNTGVRFSISRNVNKEEIKQFVDALVFHYPKALSDEGKTVADVHKAFKTALENVSHLKQKEAKVKAVKDSFIIEQTTTIKDIDKNEWDYMLGENGNFNYAGLLSLEDVFTGNSKPEENWAFYYFILRDENRKPIIATFFTSTILKDDMLAPESISLQIEEKRKHNPYYLTSKTLTMGSMLTEGHHYYINRQHPQWENAMVVLLKKVVEIQDKINANTLLLRDFDKEDIELKEIFIKEGFAPISMPNSSVVDNMNWKTEDELLQSVSYRNRKHIRSEVLKLEHVFEIEYKKELTDEEADYYYKLYLNVEHKNKALNMFDYPKDILKKLSKHPNWEFMILKLKSEFDTRTERKAVAAGWCHITDKIMAPMFLGLDYTYNPTFLVYKQAMYQVLKRARMLNISKVYLGLSADFEKRKYGAVQHARVAYIQVKDNYNMEVIESMAANVKITV